MSTAAIIAVGDELLIGQTVNSNAAWLGDRLTGLGYRVTRVVTVGDEPEAIREALEQAAARNRVVITTGGLGPTHDDRTREVICGILSCNLQMDADQLARIEGRFAERGVPLNERSRRQALVPAACRVLPNNYGSAPGLAFSIGEARVYALPGVPWEMQGITEEHILPEIAPDAGVVNRSVFLLFGPPESALADLLADLEPLLDHDISLAYLPSPGGIRLRAMQMVDRADVAERYTRLLAGIRERGERWIVAEEDIPLPEAVGRILREKRMRMAVAESCTGGMIGSMLTDTPGSSEYFAGGIIAYANRVKVDMLGVHEKTLAEVGAVSRETAEQMAEGARERMEVEVAVAVTGVAGPGGGTTEKPVGTVWIAVAGPSGTIAREFRLGRERAVVRERAAYTALDMVRRYLRTSASER